MALHRGRRGGEGGGGRRRFLHLDCCLRVDHLLLTHRGLREDEVEDISSYLLPFRQTSWSPSGRVSAACCSCSCLTFSLKIKLIERYPKSKFLLQTHILCFPVIFPCFLSFLALVPWGLLGQNLLDHFLYDGYVRLKNLGTFLICIFFDLHSDSRLIQDCPSTSRA